MNRNQAVRLWRAAQSLPEDLGTDAMFRDGRPCCALGHLAAAAGA